MAARTEDEIRSPLKAIRANCLQCVGSSNEVRLCTAKGCHLFPFRTQSVHPEAGNERGAAGKGREKAEGGERDEEDK